MVQFFAFLEAVSWSLFQNSVSFERGLRKTSFSAGFSYKSKVAFPKTEVLEKPP